jgi:hypothetical protein
MERDARVYACSHIYTYSQVYAFSDIHIHCHPELSEELALSLSNGPMHLRGYKTADSVLTHPW